MDKFKKMLEEIKEIENEDKREDIKEEDLCPICFTRASNCEL